MGIIFPTFVLFLSVIDAFTTWYVVTNGIGYETNAAIAWATNNVEFYLLKVIITALMLYGIASFCNGYEKLRMVSFTSIAFKFLDSYGKNLSMKIHPRNPLYLVISFSLRNSSFVLIPHSVQLHSTRVYPLSLPALSNL